jgi:hypothetical protein
MFPPLQMAEAYNCYYLHLELPFRHCWNWLYSKTIDRLVFLPHFPVRQLRLLFRLRKGFGLMRAVLQL